MTMLQAGFGSSGSGYQVQRSARLRAAASAYFSRTLTATTGNPWTWSGWVKRGTLGSRQILFGATDGNNTGFGFDSADKFVFFSNSGADQLSTAVFRDPSAFGHLFVNSNGTTVNAWWNNQQIANITIASTAINTAVSHTIGRLAGSALYYFDGYLTEVNFVSGQALTPTSFGEQDITTRMWVPKTYTGVYGTNGFELDFSDITSTTTLGNDKSGNGNNWTANNISLTSGITYDSMLDVPGLPWADGGNGRGNYCTWNPLDSVTNKPTQGNLRVGHNPQESTLSTQFNSSGKWYYEFVYDTLGGGSAIGIGKRTASNTTFPGADADGYGFNPNSGNKNNAGVSTAYGATCTTGDVIGVAYDLDNGKIWWAKNGVWQASGDPAAGTSPAYSGLSGEYAAMFGISSSGSGAGGNANFGQRPFAYTPPTGFNALNTANLPDPTGAAAKPWEHFDVVLATGANIKTTAEAVFPSNYLEWIKDRANANNNQLIDIVRGSSAVLQSNTTAAETTYSAPSGSSVAWVWKAGGAAVSNTAGSITSQVSANTAAGVSVVTYTGALTGAGTSTIGHGLGIAPKMIISKSRNVAGSEGGSWFVQHSALGANKFLQLNSTSATQDSVATGGGSLPVPTSSVFSATWNSGSGVSGNNYIAYCFAEVPSFSRFGSYTGNGSADGPFVFCGFRPRYVLIKRTDAAGFGWHIWDTARETYNQMQTVLFPNTADADSTPYYLDTISCGFKPRGSGSSTNATGGTYIYAAFSEAPFKFANAR